MNRKQRWVLYGFVLIGGGVLMVLEIGGGRMLAPYFGSDIFVWGSIIGVFMVALAAGYYLGGRLADRAPRLTVLAALEAAAGLLIMLLPAVSPRLCEAISQSGLGPRSAPFLSALLLFTIPSVLLAMASPFAVRISAREISGVGNVAGLLYALSTAGSTAGTLLTAFVLIPLAGTRAIIFTAGAVELAAAAVAFVVGGGLKSTRGRTGAAATALLAAASGLFFFPSGPGVSIDMPGEPTRKVLLLSSDDASASRIKSLLEQDGCTVKRLEDVTGANAYLQEERPYLLAADTSVSETDLASLLDRMRWLVPVLFTGVPGTDLRTALDKYRGSKRILPYDAEEAVFRRTSRELLHKHELIHYEESPYHLIMVTEQTHYDSYGNERRRRVLRFNNRIESAVYVDDLDENGRPKKYESAVSYTDLLHMGVLFAPEARTALFIGLGAGIGPMQFRLHYAMDVDAVDIDPAVERVAQKYFFLQPDAKLRLHAMDGRRFLSTSRRKYDMIVLDAYSSGGRIPFQLVTKEFFQLVREHLTAGGVVVSNVISGLEKEKGRMFKSFYKTMYAAGFKNVYVFPRFPLEREKALYKEKYRFKESYARLGLAMNVILVATQNEHRLTRTQLQATARTLLRRRRHPVKIKDMEEYAGFLYDGLKYHRPEDVLTKMDDGVIFTDDYAPTDTMYAGL